MSCGLLWLRRDLRLADNPAFAAAAERHAEVLAVFCFGPETTDSMRASAGRNAYAMAALTELERDLRAAGGRLVFREGETAAEVAAVAKAVGAAAVHAEAGHPKRARREEAQLGEALRGEGIELVLHPGFGCAEVADLAAPSGKPFGDFASFYEAWLQAPRRRLAHNPRRVQAPALDTAAVRSSVPPPSRLGIEAESRRIAEAARPGEEGSRRLLEEFIGALDAYPEDRDRPDLDATSRLSAALATGCISARIVEERLDGLGSPGAEALRGQLAWRDFYAHLAHRFPGEMGDDHDPRFADFNWHVDDEARDEWGRGRTGIPIVDAGMRQLLSEGWMHQRLRMVTATFLTKHLLIDWREGEAHFMRHLLDGEDSASIGNWQWAASTGSDPQPYFRVINPKLQQEQFDPDGTYVRRWLPELAEFPPEHLAEPWRAPRDAQEAAGCIIGSDYPRPLVDPEKAAKEAVERFGRHLEPRGRGEH